MITTSITCSTRWDVRGAACAGGIGGYGGESAGGANGASSAKCGKVTPIPSFKALAFCAN